MPCEGEQDTTGRRWESVPIGIGPVGMTTSAINGVWLNQGEQVVWTWSHGPGGSYVSGYTIITLSQSVTDAGTDEQTEA